MLPKEPFSLPSVSSEQCQSVNTLVSSTSGERGQARMNGGGVEVVRSRVRTTEHYVRENTLQ